MALDPDHEAQLGAMRRLGWGASDLYVAALVYGDVGTLHDVELHLRSGDHLGPMARAYIDSALRDAELDAEGPAPA